MTGMRMSLNNIPSVSYHAYQMSYSGAFAETTLRHSRPTPLELLLGQLFGGRGGAGTGPSGPSQQNPWKEVPINTSWNHSA